MINSDISDNTIQREFEPENSNEQSEKYPFFVELNGFHENVKVIVENEIVLLEDEIGQLAESQ